MKKQMEMPLDTAQCQARRPFRSHARRSRARWWFQQMRQAVESAADWPPAPPPEPEPKKPCLALMKTR